MWGTSKHTGVSEIDVKAVATAYVLNIKLVSDDIGVQGVAKEFEVMCLNSLEVLKLMLDKNHIHMKKIREVVAYWRYNNDSPKDLETQYQVLFDEEAPLWDYDEE